MYSHKVTHLYEVVTNFIALAVILTFPYSGYWVKGPNGGECTGRMSTISLKPLITIS
jgi:hypothetical protein